MCINKTSAGTWVPSTVTELTDKLLRVTPSFLGNGLCDLLHEGGYAIQCLEGADLFCAGDDYMPHLNTGKWPHALPVRDIIASSPYVVRRAFPTHTVVLDYGDGFRFTPDKPFTLTVKVFNNDSMQQQFWCNVKAYAPSGVAFPAGDEFLLSVNTNYGEMAETKIVIDAAAFVGGKLDVLIDVALVGRHTSTPVKATLLRG